MSSRSWSLHLWLKNYNLVFFLNESISFLNNQVQWFECSQIQFSKCEVSPSWPQSVTSQSEDLCLSLFSYCFYKIFWQEPLEVESVSFVLQIQRNRVSHCVGGMAARKGGWLSALHCQPEGRGYTTSKPTPLTPGFLWQSHLPITSTNRTSNWSVSVQISDHSWWAFPIQTTTLKPRGSCSWSRIRIFLS